MKEYPALVAGVQKKTRQKLDIIYPYTNKAFAKVHLVNHADIEHAIAAAVASFDLTRKMSSHERAEVLANIVSQLQQQREFLAKIITQENGKPIKDAYGEVDRAITTFTIAKEEAKRIEGEYLPVDILKATKQKRAIVARFPVGPVSGITPFNFPLNLVAHKIAPAIAAGCPILLKPASKTPISALLLGDIIVKAGWPKGAISILPCKGKDGEALVTDERIKLFSFTGSVDNGWALKAKAGKKKVVLELGGNAAVIIAEDANLERAAERCAWGGFYYSGQNCIHVQRIHVQDKVYDAFVKLFINHVKKLKLGDPMKQDTDMSSMIDKENTERIQHWIGEAVKRGARVLYKGKAPKGIVPPVVLTHVNKATSLGCKEAFGPVVIIERYKGWNEALKLVNDSDFGLQAGVFTKDLNKAWKAFEELVVGGVMINEIPTFRVDNMPYGGVKDSGFSREGIKYAIEDMTERRVLVMHLEEP